MAKRGPRTRGRLAKAVGARVKEIREAKGLSQAELARRADAGKSQVSEVESGRRNPTLASLESLARALRVSPAKFFEEPKPPGKTQADRVLTRLVERLQGYDASLLQPVEVLLDAFERAVQRTR